MTPIIKRINALPVYGECAIGLNEFLNGAVLFELAFFDEEDRLVRHLFNCFDQVINPKY